MFICSECGTKYEIMPKFCDCGNDIFIEEQEQKTTDYTPQEEKPLTLFGITLLQKLSKKKK